MTNVGFIGMGDQGGPMAQRVIDAGFPTTLWARRAETLAPYAGSAATVAASPAELGAASDVVCICVFDDAGVEQVTTGPDGVLAGLAPGGVIVVHSTVHPDTIRRLAVLAADHGCTFVDAPVSGGGLIASQGKLLVMVGGSDADVERVRPVLDTFGDPVLHLGPLGAGALVKTLNNLLFAAHLGIATDVFALAQSLGVDAAPFAEAIAHGSGRSYAFEVAAGMGGSPAPLADHIGPLLRKDVGISAELAAAADASEGVLFDAADLALEVMRHPRPA